MTNNTDKNCIEENRLGKFSIEWEQFKHRPDDLKIILKDVIIVSARYDAHTGIVKYYAYSDKFSRVPKIKKECPEYVCALTVEQGIINDTITFKEWKQV